VIMNKRFLQLALRMVEYSSLTLERVDLSKRIDSVRRIVAEAVSMNTSNPEFDVAALPDPTPEQSDFAQKVLTIADRVRRVLVEVARLEREYPIEGMLGLVDQERPPPQRRLSDVTMIGDLSNTYFDEDDESDAEARQYRWAPEHKRRSMLFRDRALSTQSARRTLQKIYNLEVRAFILQILLWLVNKVLVITCLLLLWDRCRQ